MKHRSGWMRRLRVGLWCVLVPAVAVLVVRAFVGDVYYVDSHSMEPVIHGDARGGEYVFVLYDHPARPERFDLVVIELPGVDEPLVKRVVALPGESVQIADGDLFIQSARLPPDAPRPAPVLIFDAARHDLLEYFHVEEPNQNRLLRTAAGWHLDARGAQHVLAKSRSRVFDDYLAPDGSRVEGKRYANDLAIEVELLLWQPWKEFELTLTEENDLFVLRLIALEDGRAEMRLERTDPTHAPGQETVCSPIPFDGRALHNLRFSNFDNVLQVDLDHGAAKIEMPYASNSSPERIEGNVRHAVPRIVFGGSDTVADIHALRVWRDVTYYDLGRHATTQAETLAPDEVFVIGDNSGESVDSREWGPVRLDDILGRPIAVVWPPSSWRWLRGAEAR
jgi:signal peptidase I